MTQEEQLIDERMMYRINRLEKEKEKQYRKHRQKIEQRDWFSELNKQGEDNGRRVESRQTILSEHS